MNSEPKRAVAYVRTSTDKQDTEMQTGELEFVLPILCFFKGNADQQKKLWETSKICPQFGREDYSNMMMALALQNRFIEFHDWFSTEIKNGASTIEDVAISVFPPQE